MLTDSDWNRGIKHIDVWTGSSTTNGGQNQINCEDDLTPNTASQSVIRQPATNLAVNCTCAPGKMLFVCLLTLAFSPQQTLCSLAGPATPATPTRPTARRRTAADRLDDNGEIRIPCGLSPSGTSLRCPGGRRIQGADADATMHPWLWGREL